MNLVPYIKADGKWSIPEYEMNAIFTKLAILGYIRKVFYTGSVTTHDEFLSFFKKPENMLMVAYEIQDPVLLAWINNFSGNHAMAHFCATGKNPRLVLQAAKDILVKWFSATNVSGPVLDFVLGILPSKNEIAVRFAEKIGGVIVGRIPKMLHDFYDGGYTEATILYIPREVYHG